MSLNFEDIKIGEVCDVGDGAHASIKRQDSGVLYLSSRNFKDGRLDLSKVYYISEEDYEKHFKEKGKALTKTRPGDVALSIIGTIGEPYVVKSSDRFGLSSAVAFLRPNPEVVDSDFLYYWLKGPEFQSAVYAVKGGVAQGYVSLEMIRGLPFRKFTLVEQKSIAQILRIYDNLIENNNRRIAILENMAQSLYREWFVNFRFPGHENCKFKDSPLGRIPEGWEVKTVKDFGSVITGKTPSKKKPEYYNSQDVPFLKTPDMHGHVFATEIADYLAKPGADSQKGKYIPENSICVACIGARAGVVAITPCEVQTNQQINAVVLFEDFYREYFYLFASTLQEKIHAIGSSGATMTNVSKGKFESIELVFPPKETLKSFSQLGSPIFNEILNLQWRNSNLKIQRDMLLPKLVSGKIDLKG